MFAWLISTGSLRQIGVPAALRKTTRYDSAPACSGHENSAGGASSVAPFAGTSAAALTASALRTRPSSAIGLAYFTYTPATSATLAASATGTAYRSRRERGGAHSSRARASTTASWIGLVRMGSARNAELTSYSKSSGTPTHMVPLHQQI